MNKCPICGATLVTNEYCFSYAGKLYCSAACALRDVMLEAISDDTSDKAVLASNVERAIRTFDNDVEKLAVEDVLGEDLNTVCIAVSLVKRVSVPKCMSASEALDYVAQRYNAGLIEIDADTADSARVSYWAEDKMEAHTDD